MEDYRAKQSQQNKLASNQKCHANKSKNVESCGKFSQSNPAGCSTVPQVDEDGSSHRHVASVLAVRLEPCPGRAARLPSRSGAFDSVWSRGFCDARRWLYPLMKRFTHYPQFVLGLAFNWGAVMGWSAVHNACNWPVCLSLYLAGISWTMNYDTIYAHQDKYDDVIIGMRSTAIKFGSQTPVCLGCFATLMVSSLAYTGYLCHLAMPYYASVAAIAAHLSHQIYTLDIDDREDCANKFRSNRHVGLLLFLGIVSGTYMKEEDVESESVIIEDVGKLLIPRLEAEE